MTRPARLLILAGATLAAAAWPGSAAATGSLSLRPHLRPEALSPGPGAGVPPLPWRDRVITGRAALRAGAARVAANPAHYYRTKRGYKVLAQLSAAYPDGRRVPRSYVDFLDNLPHGRELRRLRIYIAPQSEVQTVCGGTVGVLACYVPVARLMVVPGNQTATYGGVSTKFVVAHEYGHHIAANRRNPPFAAIYRRYGGTVAFGPKRWSSQKRICAEAGREYFPGDEGEHYAANPGEAWAETYAHLTYPDVAWMFAPSLTPSPASLRAARRDVLHPWTHDRHRVFGGRLGRDRRHKTFHFAVHLDGGLRLTLAGPRTADYDLRLDTGAERPLVGRDPGHRSRDVIALRTACRKDAVAHLAVTVRRRHGSGGFRLKLAYAG